MHLIPTIKFSKSHSMFFKRCTMYMLQTANVLKSNFTSVAVFWLSNVQKMTIKTWTNVPESSPEWWTYNALRLYWSKLNPACLCYVWVQTSKTSQGTMSDSTSQPSSRTAKSGTFKGDQAQWHWSWSSFLTES